MSQERKKEVEKEREKGAETFLCRWPLDVMRLSQIFRARCVNGQLQRMGGMAEGARGSYVYSLHHASISYIFHCE